MRQARPVRRPCYTSRVHPGLAPEGDPIDLAGWQHRILDRVLVWASAVAFPACVTGVWLSWTAGVWSLVVLDIGCYLLMLTVTVKRDLPYALRAATLVGVVLAVGVGVLLAVGPFGVGVPWLLAVPCLAAVLFDIRRFWIAQVAVVGALLMVWGLVRLGWVWQGLPVDPAWWPMAWTSVLVLSLMLGLPMATLMGGLQGSLATASAQTRALEAEVARRRASEGERATLERQLILSQKMEGVGQMAGGIAHDFNNVLTVVQLEAAMAKGLLDPGSEAAEALDRLLQATRSAAALSSKLLLFSRRRTSGKQRIEVDVQVRAFEPLLSRLVGERVVLALDLHATNARILAEPIELEQLLTNLAANARDAMPGGGTLRISTVMTLGDQGPGVRLEVVDNGVGMDSPTAARVFEPFFTTKAEGSGTGLGLTTVYAIVRNLDGVIELHSSPGGGTCFRIHVPIDRTAGPERIPEYRPTRPLPARARILVVDDQDAVRSTVERALVLLGCEVWAAGSGREALALLEGKAELPDLVITDVAMPVMTGVDLAERLRERYTALSILAMSGFIGDDQLTDRLSRIGVAVLRKPFTPDDLIDAVGASLVVRIGSRTG